VTYDSGRSVADIPQGIRPSVWRRVLQWAREDFRHRLGHPAMLERCIKTGLLVPSPVKLPADTFWTRSVTSWHTWLDSSSSAFGYRPYTLDYRKPGYDRRLECHSLAIPEAENLVRKEIIHDFSCDISAIKGISASKSFDHDIPDIDDFPQLRCPELAEPVTPEHLRKNMAHRELRLDRMRFAEYPWTERRFYWLNDGGSHHFGAARYQACRLNQAVTLTGTLYRYSVDVQMVRALRNIWRLFVIPKEELFGSFYDSLNAFECPFAWSALPANMHDSVASEVELCIVWLERDNSRANAVAGVLAASGFPDFGEMLTRLARSEPGDPLPAG